MKRVKRSFKTELFFSFLFIALITLLLSGSFLISAVQQKTEYDYEKKSAQQLQEAEEVLERFFGKTEQIIKGILNDKRITESLHETDSWAVKKAYNRLFSLAVTEVTRDPAVFRVYDESGRCVLSTAEADQMESLPVYWGILKEAMTHPDQVILHNATYEVNSKDAAIYMAQAMVSDDSCIGFVIADISDRKLEEILKEIHAGESEMVVLDEFWEEIYSTETAGQIDLASVLHRQKFYGTQETRKEDFTYYTREIPDRGLHLVIGKRDVFSDSLKRTMVLVLFALAGGALLLSFIVARILSSRLMSPLESLTEAMGKVREGDLSVQMNSSRPDEFGQLARDFDDMTKALDVYVKLRSKQQQELSDSNIAMMQAQLNPHFLYNTLDSIKWIAKANHVPELATLSSSLAKILRASISADIFVPLSDEISLVNYYVDIQRIRFSDKFSFDAEVPMELEDVIVPKLILQPIVENAIVHGLKDREDGYIFLNVYEQDKRLIIDVEDNGCGMDEDMLQTLNERDREKLKGHIGFYNVDTIIRLHYGLNYGLHARNLKEGGVRVTVELPVRRAENMITEDQNAENSGDR